MQKNEWTYQKSNKIKNFKDLELEKQRLQLYQKFLEELLEQDKIAFKKSIEPQNLINTAIREFFNKSKTTNGLVSGGVLSTILRWVIDKFFR